VAIQTVHLKTFFGKKMSEIIEQKTLFEISKKTLTTLENLLNSKQIDLPVKFNVLLDIAVGALFESEIIEQVNLLDVVVEDKDMMYDIVEFEQGGKYNLHDIVSQIITFRLITLMQEYLKHINVKYESYKETVLESKTENN